MSLSFVQPSVPTLVLEPPAGDGWLHEVRIEQRFQRLTGAAFREGRVEGAAVRFAFADGRTYTGRADGDTITGDGWRAVRVGD